MTNQTDELLNSLTDEQIAAYSTENVTIEHIVIGSNRYPRVPESLKNVAVQHDHNVMVVTFDCPRYWDELDMSEMSIHVNYMREDGITGMTMVDNIVVDEDDPTIMHFDWSITKHTTEVNGTLSFLVCIKKEDEEGNIINHWNSELNKEMYISEGLECKTSIYALYPDIVTYMLQRIGEITWDCVTTYQMENPIQVDKTLTLTGFAADAKTVGVKITDVNTRAEAIENYVAPMHFTKQHVWKKSKPGYKYTLIGAERNNDDDQVFRLKAWGSNEGYFTIQLWYTDTISIDENTGVLLTGQLHHISLNIKDLSDSEYYNHEIFSLSNVYVALSEEAFTEFGSAPLYYINRVGRDHGGSATFINFIGHGVTYDVSYAGDDTNELLYADNSSAHPKTTLDDGTTYNYLGLFNNIPFNMGQSQIICVQGGGKPTALSFEFPPKFVLRLGLLDIQVDYSGDRGEGTITSNWNSETLLSLPPIDLLRTYYLKTSVGNVKKSEDGKTIYIDSAASSGAIEYWLGIG